MNGANEHPDRVGFFTFALPTLALLFAAFYELSFGERVFFVLMVPVAGVLGFHIDGRNTRAMALKVVATWIVGFVLIIAFAKALVFILAKAGVIG